MKKSLFFAALFAVAAFLPTVSLHAQRFEWAKGYSSHNNVNEIKGSVTDDEGNLYILGEVAGDATWEGDSVVPSEIGNRKGVSSPRFRPMAICYGIRWYSLALRLVSRRTSRRLATPPLPA